MKSSQYIVIYSSSINKLTLVNRLQSKFYSACWVNPYFWFFNIFSLKSGYSLYRNSYDYNKQYSHSLLALSPYYHYYYHIQHLFENNAKAYIAHVTLLAHMPHYFSFSCSQWEINYKVLEKKRRYERISFTVHCFFDVAAACDAERTRQLKGQSLT